MGLDINNVTKNDRFKVIIDAQGLIQTVTAILREDISIAGGSQFGTAGDSSLLAPLSDIKNKVLGAFNTGASLSSSAAGNIGTTTQFESKLSYSGPSKPSFTLPLSFTAISDSDDVRKPVLELYKTVYPTLKGGSFGGLFVAPLGYNPKSGKGTLSIQVGRWLRFRKMVMTNVEFTFSRETLNSGKPLKAVGSISFEPFQAIEFKELKRYITFGG